MTQYLGVHYQYSNSLEATQITPGLTPDARVEWMDNDPAPSLENCSENLKRILTQMPSDWIEQLSQAARKGSDSEILDLIQFIPSPDPGLADRLEHWSNNFQFDRILDLVATLAPSQDIL
jgi:hypothetical protein